MSKTQTLHVVGMHCPSCVVLTEESLKEAPGITNAKANLHSRTVTISGELPESENETAQKFSPFMPKGYSLSVEAPEQKILWKEFVYALPIAVLVIIGFLALQKTGLVQLGGAGAGLGTAFVIGLIASVSTCLAVVGGLVLSVSATFAKTGEKSKPQMFFHGGRLIGFFVLGGVLGTLGKSMQLGATGTLILNAVIGIIMLILGFNLLDISHKAKKLQLHLPKQLGNKIHSLKNSTHFAMPFVLGALTFFLPCGFTQSMQAYALTTGGFISGGMTMLVFALGTLPMLALLSFSAFSIQKASWKGTFFKTAGLVVVTLAVVNILGSLAVAGIIDPVF